jgi:L-amino acid N-acyltransferase YncA
MISALSELIVREASTSDAVPLANILNAIIEAGGTTAMEAPLNAVEFKEHFLYGSDVISCAVAVDPANSEPVGFHALKRYAGLPEAWGADIATFARMKRKLPGVGTALFAATKAKSRKLGLVNINAAIRADNRVGLAFYEKMGFRTYETLRRVPLKDGTPVDRILKRYDVV